MTNYNPINGHIATIALSQANHPRVMAMILRNDTKKARLALTLRINQVIGIVADQDEWEISIMDRVILASARTLNDQHGPRVQKGIEEVVNSMISD